MSAENKALVRRFYEDVMGNGKVQALDEVCAPDFVDHSPMPGQAPGLKGMKDAFAMWMGAFTDMKLNVEEMIAEGDSVATRFSLSVKHTGEIMGAPPTGKSVTFHALDMIKVRNGKCAEAWHFGDEMMVLASLGVKPPM